MKGLAGHAAAISGIQKSMNTFLTQLEGSDYEGMQEVGAEAGESRFGATKRERFDVEAYFDSLGIRKTAKTYRNGQVIFLQGDPARDVLYIRSGRVKRTVVSRAGREAVVSILGPGDFFGEWCLSEQPVCIATATAMEPTSILTIAKHDMLRALHSVHALSDGFIAYLLGRTQRIEEDLIDQLFNSTEKRLARALLRLGRYGVRNGKEMRIPRVSQQTLAEMIGTTRTHVNYFMNKFRRMGFIEYRDDIRVRTSLATVILREQERGERGGSSSSA